MSLIGTPSTSTTTSNSNSNRTNSPAKWRMPAEWTSKARRHEACLILYPHNTAVFRQQCQYAQLEIDAIAKAIVHHGDEDVILFCSPLDHVAMNAVTEKFRDEPRIHVMECSSNDTWARDTGPTFVLDDDDESRLIAIDWQFNGYGGPALGTYWPCDLDKKVASTMCRAIADKYSVPIHIAHVPIVLEGGSIHVDGEGTCLTTAECLLNVNRNPDMTKEQIEITVLTALGCTKMLWLPLGLAYDEDTNGHIDNMACFVRPGEIILSWTDDCERDPENYDRCRQAMEYLSHETDANGRTLTVQKLYLPPPLRYTQEEVQSINIKDGTSERQIGERLAASYVNFYIANKAIIVPQFGVEPSDGDAISTLQSAFPNHKIIGVPSREILLGGGNIHCVTQQMPIPLVRSNV